MDEYKRLNRVFLRKQALRRELWDMLEAIPRTTGAVPNPDRVNVRKKILRLDEEISELDWKLFRLHSNLAPGAKQVSTDREPVTTSAAASAGKKLKNPAENPVMTMAGVRAALDASRSVIYVWLNEGKLKRASLGWKPGRRGKVLIRTVSVKKLLREDPE